MHLAVKYDSEASVISEKPTFFCDKHELHRADIADFKKRKLLAFVEEDTLPEIISCDVLVYLEGFRKARIVFFNSVFELPAEVYEEPLLNRNLIEWSRKNTGFYLEFEMPLKKDMGELFLDLEL